MKQGQTEIARITLYREIRDDELTGLYEEHWTTKLTVSVTTPFGQQEFDVSQDTEYSEKPKSLAGNVRRFESVVSHSIKECLKLLRANMVRERPTPSSKRGKQK